MASEEDYVNLSEDVLLQSFVRLHELAWMGSMGEVFHLHAVCRDDVKDRIPVVTPEVVTTLSWMNKDKYDDKIPALLAHYAVKSVYIRHEYQEMLRDLIQKCSLNEDGPVVNTEPDPVFGIRNPFKRQLSQMRTRGACVTGSPGIGKSVFLLLVLVLRLLAGVPAVVVLHSGGAFIATGRKVELVPLKSLIRFHAPPNTWFLVDCNFRSVPEEILNVAQLYSGFIVQAASQRSDNFAWLTKVAMGRPPRLYMNFWTLGELICARDLQNTVHISSERQLRSFVKKFGSAPRYVYGDTDAPKHYETLLKGKIRSFELNILEDAIRGADGDFRSFDPRISRLVVHTIPNKDDREQATRGLQTRYLTSLLYHHFKEKQDFEPRRLYTLFLANGFTRASVGFILERLCLEELPKGGEWRMTEMLPSDQESTTHFEYSPNSREVFLRLGYDSTLLGILARQAAHTTSFNLLSTTKFKRGQKLLLSDGFYIPSSRTYPSLGAFVYQNKVATLFQVSIDKEHDMNEERLKFLLESGAEVLDVIVVTCPMKGNRGGTEKLIIDMRIRKLLRNVYHLILHNEDDESDEESGEGEGSSSELTDSIDIDVD